MAKAETEANPSTATRFHSTLSTIEEARSSRQPEPAVLLVPDPMRVWPLHGSHLMLPESYLLLLLRYGMGPPLRRCRAPRRGANL